MDPPLTSPALPVGTLTFLMTDVEGSTRAWSTAPHEAKLAHERHDRIVVDEIEKNQGQVVESGREGDSFTGVFRQATDAVACAVGIERGIGREIWPDGIEMKVRIALHTGEAELRSGHYVGAPLYRCARMLALANGGQVLISTVTEELVADSLPEGTELRDLGTHALRDFARPEHVYQLAHPDLVADFPPLASAEAERSNLPEQLTTFVGREAEAAALMEVVSRNRMVTITGPGGVGKSRLAIEVARVISSRWPDGVWWVDLSPIDDPKQVAGTVAAAMQLTGAGQATDVVKSWLHRKHALVVLDSCEHVLHAVAEISRSVLAHCPGVSILATSREPLGVSGEARWPLKPLRESEAVGLFVQRAHLVDPDFQITERNRGDVVAICGGLDALPLAIELAASRLSVMSERDISRQLSDRLHLLPGAMTAALEWSYRLLSESESTLFRRLSVFRGGFTLESATAVCSDAVVPNVLDSLSGLVQKSMVVVERQEGGETRYRLLELQAEFAADKWRASDNQPETEKRHYEYFLASASQKNPYKPRALPVATVLANDLWKRREYTNLWAALRWARANELGMGLELGAVVAGIPSGDAVTMRGWLKDLLETSPADSRTRMAALRATRNIAFRLGDAADALSQAQACEKLAREENDTENLIATLHNIAAAQMDMGRLDEAEAALREGDRLVERLNNPPLWTLIQNGYGCLLLVRGQYEQARQVMVPCVAVMRRDGAASMGNLSSVTQTLADAEMLCGDIEDGEALFREALLVARDISDHWNVVGALGGLARGATARGEYARSVRLAAAHARLSDEYSCRDQPWWIEQLRLSQEISRRELGEAKAEEATREGLVMDFDRTIEYALEGAGSHS